MIKERRNCFFHTIIWTSLYIYPTSTIHFPKEKYLMNVLSQALSDISQESGGGDRIWVKNVLELLISFIFISIAIHLLWNNEYKKAKTYNLLKLAQNSGVETSDLYYPDSNQNYLLVYASGETTNRKPLRDNEIGMELNNAIKLVRIVEVYQWREYKQQDGS